VLSRRGFIRSISACVGVWTLKVTFNCRLKVNLKVELNEDWYGICAGDYIYSYFITMD